MDKIELKTTKIIIIIMDETEYVTNVYNSIASHFNVTRAYNWSWITEYINKLPQDSKVLDIGCGTGRNMLYENIEFTGVDTSKEFIKICLSKGLNAVEGDMCNLPLESERYDAILSIASFHHLSTNDRRLKALKEMNRVLKCGATLLLSVWSFKQPEKTKRKFDKYGDNIVKWNKYNDVFERYYYIFEISELLHLFKKSNFQIQSHNWECGNEVFQLVKTNNF